MNLLQNFGPAFAAMALIVVGSAFFSCSEAALFSLQPEDRRRLKRGTPPQRTAVRLLAHPERLLMAILFWNLILNIGYFAIASVVSIRLQSAHHSAEAGMVALVALITLILLGEMVPKTIGVLAPCQVASIVSFPLTLAVKVFSPLAPIFSAVNHALRRLLFPNFQKEQYLELADLEQAITISTPNEELASQERTALQNIVHAFRPDGGRTDATSDAVSEVLAAGASGRPGGGISAERLFAGNGTGERRNRGCHRAQIALDHTTAQPGTLCQSGRLRSLVCHGGLGVRHPERGRPGSGSSDQRIW